MMGSESGHEDGGGVTRFFLYPERKPKHPSYWLCCLEPVERWLCSRYQTPRKTQDQPCVSQSELSNTWIRISVIGTIPKVPETIIQNDLYCVQPQGGDHVNLSPPCYLVLDACFFNESLNSSFTLNGFFFLVKWKSSVTERLEPQTCRWTSVSRWEVKFWFQPPPPPPPTKKSTWWDEMQEACWYQREALSIIITIILRKKNKSLPQLQINRTRKSLCQWISKVF